MGENKLNVQGVVFIFWAILLFNSNIIIRLLILFYQDLILSNLVHQNIHCFITLSHIKRFRMSQNRALN